MSDKLLGQPVKKIQQESWKEDFRYVHSAQLTPLDFWEMVQDCDALKREQSYLGGGKLIHRVDTAKLIERYSRWLSSVIRSKHVSTWPGARPDVIFTLAEDPGLRFARLVASALSLPRWSILHAPRAVVLGDAEPSDALNSELNKCKDRGGKVLLVDDGINRGKTMKALIDFIRKHQVKLLGALVLDNRLKQDAICSLESEMEGAPIQALYTWPFSPQS